MKLEWDAIWEDFEEWYEKKDQSTYCDTCKHTHFASPEWEDQQVAIARIVNKHVRREPRKA